jgi:hypothetical protein
MADDCPACTGERQTGPRLRTARDVAIGVSSTLGALLVPKCPFCLAAYLSVLGITTEITRDVFPLIKPMCIALAALAFVSVVVRRARAEA